MHTGRAEHSQPWLCGGIADAGPDGRAHDIYCAKNNRQPFWQACRPCCGCGQCMRLPGPVHDGGQKVPEVFETECRDGLRAIASSSEIPKGEFCLRRVGCSNSGQVQIEPVLAVHRCRGPGEEIRGMALHPAEMRSHLADIDAAASVAVYDFVCTALGQCSRLVRSAGIQPKPAVVNRLIVGVQ